MNLSEIINTYKSQYKKENVAEEIKDAIQNIGAEEYEKHYKKIYLDFIQRNIIPSMVNIENSTLSEINSFYFDRDLNVMFNSKECIFYEGDDYYGDFEFFRNLNESDFIKSILDEKSEHGVREDGHLLSSILGSICTQKYYENISPLDMYAIAWWKINTTHPFKNGNKRTSFIGVKSSMLSDSLFHWISSLVDLNINDLKEFFKSSEFENKVAPKLIKQMKFWKKPTSKEVVEFSNEFIQRLDEEVWEYISSNPVINGIIDNVVSDVSKAVSEQISTDYILSIFVAKIKATEYKENNDELKHRVIEILKADLLVTILTNLDYINSRIKAMSKEFVSLTENVGPKAFLNKLTLKMKQSISG